MDFDLRAHTILLTVAGSRAYGLHRPDSDVDLKGVAIPPAPYFHGFARKFAQADDAASMAPFAVDLTDEEQTIVASTKLEGSIYGLRKFARLASECNPNILDALFCRDAEVRHLHPLGRRLREHREAFLSARARHTYAGYANAQLKRIRTHRTWLLDPPQREPTRADFGLPPMPTIPRQQLMAAHAAVRSKVDSWNIDYGTLQPAGVIALQERITGMLADRHLFAVDDFTTAARSIGLDDNLIAHMQAERAYGAAHRQWVLYNRWKTHRNPARAALEAEHGYDTKHGAHLVRLLRMGCEILRSGRVQVWRGDLDAEELQGIRDGAWSYDDLLAFADTELQTIARLEEAGPAVPDKPDMNALDALVADLVETFLSAAR